MSGSYANNSNMVNSPNIDLTMTNIPDSENINHLTVFSVPSPKVPSPSSSVVVPSAITDVTQYDVNHTLTVKGECFTTHVGFTIEKNGELNLITSSASTNIVDGHIEIIFNTNGKFSGGYMTHEKDPDHMVAPQGIHELSQVFRNGQISTVTHPMQSKNLAAIVTGSELPLYIPADVVAISGAFVNLTGYYVPPDVSTILSFGPRFVPPQNLSLATYIDHLYQVNNSAHREHIDPLNHLQGFLNASYDAFLKPLMESTSTVDRKLFTMLSSTKTYLSEHPEFCIVQSDKSKSTVLMTRKDYQKKMETWIMKCTIIGAYEKVTDEHVIRHIRAIWFRKYHVLVKDLSSCREQMRVTANTTPYPNKIHRLLHKLDHHSAPFPYLYGVVKTHKDEKPCRPICGTRRWYGYALQKLTNYTLRIVSEKLLCPNNVGNITKAASHIRAIVPQPGYVFVKLDIVDMYTSMDRTNIIAIIRRLVNSEWYKGFNLIPADLLLRCLELNLGDMTLFTYGGRIFKQKLGLPQGSCDSGLLATIQLDHMLQLHNKEIFAENGVIHWWKYVDDILMYVPLGSITAVKENLEKYTELRFTLELEEPPEAIDLQISKEVQGIISFLDLNIIRCSNKVQMRAYKKSIASDRMCHFLSNSAEDWKKGTIMGYMSRILLRVSNGYLKHDIRCLDKMLRSNMYPLFYSDPVMYKQLVKHRDDFHHTLKYTEYDSQHPHHSLGDLKERIAIINSQLTQYEQTSTNIGPQTTPLFSTYMPPPPQPVYNKSTPYVAEDFRMTLKRIYRELGLGDPTHRNGESLFIHLRMSLAEPDPSIPICNNRANIPSMYLLNCDDCPVVFVLSGAGPIPTILDDLSKSDNVVRNHEHATGHTVITNKIPRKLYTSAHPNIPMGQWTSLLKLIYSHIGHECQSTSELQYLPDYVHRGVLRAMHSPTIKHQDVDLLKNVALPNDMRFHPYSKTKSSSKTKPASKVNSKNLPNSIHTSPNGVKTDTPTPLPDVEMDNIDTIEADLIDLTEVDLNPSSALDMTMSTLTSTNTIANVSNVAHNTPITNVTHNTVP